MSRFEDDIRAREGAAEPTPRELVRDDVEDAIDFLAHRGESASSAPGPKPDEATLDFARYRARRIRERLLVLLDRLHAAIERRDVDRVWSLLDEAEAYRCVPAAVREEAIIMVQLPAASLRAPIRLYRYQYLLRRLGDEPMDSALDPAQLAIDLAPSASPPTSSRVRELPFRERRSPDGGPRRGGRDRRWTGSR